MKYLKRLKNELLELAEKTQVKGDTPGYVSLCHLNRKEVVTALIVLLKQVRAVDHATDDWSTGNSKAWTDYLTNLKHWLGQAPPLPKKVVEKRDAAA
jgi:hypothetical protein